MGRAKHHHFKYPILAVSLLLLVVGFFSYTQMKTGLFPDITFPKIKIIADAGSSVIAEEALTNSRKT